MSRKVVFRSPPCRRCANCDPVDHPAYLPPCSKCSVESWNMFEPAPVQTSVFSFSNMPKHLCPVCGTPLQEEGELKRDDLNEMYWDGSKVYGCPSCSYEVKE